MDVTSFRSKFVIREILNFDSYLGLTRLNLTLPEGAGDDVSESGSPDAFGQPACQDGARAG
jgi:hypothetical protein